MQTKLVKLYKLYDKFPLDKVHPLIVENPDWEDEIVPALLETGVAFDDKEISVEGLAASLRSLIEIAYVMGYQKGREEE